MAVGVRYPLVRSRAESLWAGAELRALSQQDIACKESGRDRIATLTGSLTGVKSVGGGVLRGEVATVAGLPVGNVTREGSLLALRFDGDARFLAATYALDWTVPLGKPLSLGRGERGADRVAARCWRRRSGWRAAVRARRPLCRAYRGQGCSARSSCAPTRAHCPAGIVDRAQFYGFVDGGVVGNLDGGVGAANSVLGRRRARRHRPLRLAGGDGAADQRRPLRHRRPAGVRATPCAWHGRSDAPADGGVAAPG
ncbi:hypothetical protein AB5I41_26395 [Sphingomonas sp. MMS24-JH45]